MYVVRTKMIIVITASAMRLEITGQFKATYVNVIEHINNSFHWLAVWHLIH
jgi:hypothetical protein